MLGERPHLYPNMNRPPLPYRILDMLSDGVAVVNDKRQVRYINSVFETQHNLFQDSSKKTLCWELQDLVGRFQSSSESFVSSNVLISSSGKECEVFLFSLGDKYSQANHSLILVKMDEKPSLPEVAFAEELFKTYINERSLISEPLAPEFETLKGEDMRFRLSLHNAQRAARSDLPIVLTGESGTGKEILARTIHNISHRSQGPFVDINCAAIPDTLIESELFGYERGAFTGARGEGKKGLFEEADYGTIFLDEVGDASLSTQSKILRVLEDKQFRRVGGSKNRKVDVRIISATNKDLKKRISEGLFREDLYYRLNTISIVLPPLRDRGGDIRLLANYFIGEESRRQKSNITFSEEALKVLESYSWPGNVRELRGVAEYAATMNDGTQITPQSLPSFVFLKRPPSVPNDLPSRKGISVNREVPFLFTILKEVERNLMKLAIRKSESKSEAIKLLGISRRAFYYKLREYKLD
jgi:transcriptional regulator with PAS, ATPase and Fis domain